jgi:hypothetical protein
MWWRSPFAVSEDRNPFTGWTRTMPMSVALAVRGGRGSQRVRDQHLRGRVHRWRSLLAVSEDRNCFADPDDEVTDVWRSPFAVGEDRNAEGAIWILNPANWWRSLLAVSEDRNHGAQGLTRLKTAAAALTARGERGSQRVVRAKDDVRLHAWHSPLTVSENRNTFGTYLPFEFTQGGAHRESVNVGRNLDRRRQRGRRGSQRQDGGPTGRARGRGSAHRSRWTRIATSR